MACLQVDGYIQRVFQEVSMDSVSPASQTSSCMVKKKNQNKDLIQIERITHRLVAAVYFYHESVFIKTIYIAIYVCMGFN